MAVKKTIVIKVENEQAKKAVNDLNNKINQTTKTAQKTGKGFKGVFAGMKNAILGAIPALNALRTALISTGIGAIAVAVGTLITGFATATKKGAEFAKSLSTLKAVSGATAEDMGKLSNQAKELGASTAFTASQVVQLQTELAKLGFTVSDIQNATPAILDLAASLDVSLAEAATFAGATVRAFGLTTQDTQRVVDVMAKSTASSALDFVSLQEALKLVAPTSNALGVSVEKTTALLGALADTGLKGSIAGTGLSKTFIELNKKGVTLETALEKVRNSSNGLNTAINLVGVVGAKSLLNLANAGDKIGDLEDKFLAAEGAAKSIAETRLDNLTGDTTKLSSAWEGFLLQIEDGSGGLNKLARGAVQFLTKSITFLADAIDVTVFTFQDGWANIKLYTSGASDVLSGLLSKLGSGIKKFANNALIQIGKIPIIGQAIDVEAAKKRVDEAAAAIDDAEQKIEQGRDKIRMAKLNNDTAWIRYSEQKKRQEQEVEAIKTQKALEDQQQKVDEADEEKRKKQEEQTKKEREKLKKLKEKFTKADQDFEDKTFEEKAKRQRERALAELDALKLSETEKQEAKKQINDYYNKLEADAKLKDDEAEKEKEKQKQKERLEKLQLEKDFDTLNFEEQRQTLNARRQLIQDDELLSTKQKNVLLSELAKKEKELDDKKIQQKYNVLDAVVSVAGAETGVGKALLIAKQLLQAKEAVMDLKNITFKGKKAIAEAGVNAAQNVSESSKIGFPQNLITIAAAIGQGVSIISSVKNAVKATGATGGGASVPSVTSGAASQPPSFNVVGATETSQLAEAVGSQTQQPVQAYVVSNDVTTAQSLENNIVEGATL